MSYYLDSLRTFAYNTLAEWRGLKFSELQYFHREIRLWMLAALGMLLTSTVILVERYRLVPDLGADRVVIFCTRT